MNCFLNIFAMKIKQKLHFHKVQVMTKAKEYDNSRSKYNLCLENKLQILIFEENHKPLNKCSDLLAKHQSKYLSAHLAPHSNSNLLYSKLSL